MIDWQRVGQLRDEIGSEDFGEVVELFLEEVAEVVERLRADPDPSSIGTDLHFLKGSALNLGFWRVGTLCSEGEQLAREGQGISVDIAGLLTAYDESVAFFVEGLEQNAMA